LAVFNLIVDILQNGTRVLKLNYQTISSRFNCIFTILESFYDAELVNLSNINFKNVTFEQQEILPCYLENF